MNIIKRGTVPDKWPRKTKCKKCKSELSVDERDCRDMMERPGEDLVRGFQCPVCDDWLYFRG